MLIKRKRERQARRLENEPGSNTVRLAPLCSSSALSALAVGFCFLALLPRVCRSQEISVSHIVQVTKGLRNHSEVIVAADPSSAGRLLACSMVEPARPSLRASRDVAYLSTDGGLHWSQTLEFGGSLWSSDPSCSFARHGLAFYAGLSFEALNAGWAGKTVLYRSPNGGLSWSVAPSLPQGDREFLTVDVRKNRIYAGEIVDGLSLDGRREAPLVVYESADDARSFQTRAVLSAGKQLRVFGYPGGILPDGTFATAFAAIPLSAALAGRQARQAGTLRVLLYSATRFPHVSLPTVNKIYECDAWRNSTPMPSLAVDETRGPFRGRMYLAWPDSRSGRCEILFSYSSDRGRTWSAPLKVDDDRSWGSGSEGPDDFHPVLAINPQGVVGILWYDRRQDQDNISWQPRFSASLDGGLTFLPSVRFRGAGMKIYQSRVVQLTSMAEGGANPPFRSGGPIRVSFGYASHELTGGETAGLASDPSGFFHALWIDNRTGVAQVWTARISVNGRVQANGAALSANLSDISNRAAILFSGAELNRIDHVFKIVAYVQNSSTLPIRAPLELRVLRLGSQIGEPKFDNADNHKRGAGAIFNFTPLMPAGGLEPGERTRGREIAVRLDRLVPKISRGNYRAVSEMITIDFSVLAGQAHKNSQKEPSKVLDPAPRF